MREATFVPKTVYITYIAATRERVWQALTTPEFTQQYFFGRSIEIEPRSGGNFVLRMSDGRDDVKGKVVEWSPPRRLSVTWRVDCNEAMRTLPECLVTYDIEQAGGAVKLTVERGASMGCARRPALRRTRRLAGDPLQPEERAGNRQGARHRT